ALGKLWQDAFDYGVDSLQRSVLFWDILRQRGNVFNEHVDRGKPPVLVFDYEVVVDGATLPRPCNYLLLRILPPAGVETDDTMRPFVIVDPRAGHGPGIAGMKEASQVGVALRAGHPVYLVSFRPYPEPGQTLEDVAAAEVHFLETVIARHPRSEFLPAVAGNCQGGWAIMMALAVAPERAGVVAISGAPMSYWAGKRGQDPMRYTGGLNGGAWPATLMGDLGNGQFDGAWLVTNFERLNPANSYWKKLYDVYAKADTEGPRFLEFERWWGGYFVLTTEEIRFIVNELFVGNKLAKGQVVTSRGQPIDLRRIKAPIVVICSHGDNITPPQQALNWILDLYDDVDEIKAAEQTIVYVVHPTVGHLGIFVSGRVALKEHAEFITAMDQLEALPPGLYEMVIDECQPGAEGADRFVVHLETRTLDDIRALDDGRDDEAPMAHVARLSEVGEGLYEHLVRPGVKALANETLATVFRELHPDRVQRRLISDLNPFMAPLAWAAEQVRTERRPMAEDNAFLQAERAMSDAIVDTLDRYRDARDRLQEQTFYAIWTHPLTVALAGNLAPYAEVNKPQASRRKDFEDQVALKLEAIKARYREGGFDDGLIRILVAGAAALPGIDPKALRAARAIWKRENVFTGLTRAELLRMVKEEAFLVQFDREHAMATLPDLLASRADRERALRIAREVLLWRPDLVPLLDEELARLEKVLGLRGTPTPAAAAELVG
ncbi:MAG: DUF3141 domain-containing protein, partial [Pseudomonadota bacterium]